jgi:hypothetical protein
MMEPDFYVSAAGAVQWSSWFATPGRGNRLSRNGANGSAENRRNPPPPTTAVSMSFRPV